MKKGKVSKLRPTQCVVGLAEVAVKKAELSALSPRKLDEYLLAHPIPCVVGPGEHLHLVDHHHMGLALTQMNHPDCYIEVVHDLSTVPEGKFHRVMQALDLLYLRADGQDLPLYRLPKRLADLADDPYRSLAGFVRKRDGFVKVPVPYTEFAWADFFRSRVRIDDWSAAIERALELAVSIEAQYLPGFAG